MTHDKSRNLSIVINEAAKLLAIYCSIGLISMTLELVPFLLFATEYQPRLKTSIVHCVRSLYLKCGSNNLVLEFKNGRFRALCNVERPTIILISSVDLFSIYKTNVEKDNKD